MSFCLFAIMLFYTVGRRPAKGLTLPNGKWCGGVVVKTLALSAR